MKVTVEERPGLEEPEVIIRCGRMDGQVSAQVTGDILEIKLLFRST